MLNNKKSQGMSIRIIIISVIGLLIAVVVIALLSGRNENFETGLGGVSGGYTKSCAELGGAPTVIDKSTDCQDHEEGILAKNALPGSGKKCCRCKTWSNEAGTCI
tara:strand:- start:854 stop:1168 length:315 start_codon:yes stop_codon:yes gene_type:complete